MRFKDRREAGEKLADALLKFRGKDAIVFGLPRGGVIVAAKVAEKLHLPLDLVIPRKIGHPNNTEYALAAVSENGQVVGDKKEILLVDQVWLNREIQKEREEARRRRLVYMAGRKPASIEGKTGIIVDDGIATGLTMQAAIKEVQMLGAVKIIIAVPVVPDDTYRQLEKEVDEFIALEKPKDFYAIGAYYHDFLQVTDEEVHDTIKVLK